MTRRLVLTAVLALLAGCSTASGPPPDSFYRLAPGDVGRRYGTPLLPGTVQVARFGADGVVNGRPIVYRAGGGQLRQFNYHYWVESPARQMQAAVIRAMRQANAGERIVSPDLRVLADWRVEGTLERLDYAPAENRRVIVRVELSVVDTQDGDLLLVETFDASQPVRQDTVPAAVEAFNEATTGMFARFLDRVAEAIAGRGRPPG